MPVVACHIAGHHGVKTIAKTCGEQGCAALAVAVWLALAISACTEHVPMAPAGQFSWGPQLRPIWPVEGAIVSAYGDAARKNHQGIDLAARPGDPVGAALAGDVVYTGEIRGYGKVVALSHGESFTTVYGHLGEVRVHDGEAVAAGRAIGSIGPDGYLHYEIRRSGLPVDPAPYYAVAPRPVAGGAADVSSKVREEPPGVGPIPPTGTSIREPPAPPSPKPEARVATPPPTTRPEATPPRATTTPRSYPTMPPAPATPPTSVRSSPEEKPRPVEVEERTGGTEVWSGIGLGAALVGCNLLYVPLKLGYAAVGAVVGGASLLLTGDAGVADNVWTRALGGNYFVAAAHLRGEEPLSFTGERAETPAPSPPPTPSRRQRDS